MADDRHVLPRAARELYALEPEAFIGARDALVRELKADGETERAITVKGLRRPTVAAWAANQAARNEPDLVDELLAAGERLAGAQRHAQSGKGGADELRSAGIHRREAIRRLADAAIAALDRAGRPSDNVGDDIAGTLEAATLDPEVAAHLREGTLERTVVPPSGFGGIEGFRVLEGGAGPSTKGRALTRTAATDRREAERLVRESEGAEELAGAALDQAASARAAADEAARQAEELEAAARDAERDAKRLAGEAKTARARAERAVRQLER